MTCYRASQKDTLEYDCHDDDEIVVYGILGEEVEPPIYPKTKIPRYKNSNLHSTAAVVYHIFEADEPRMCSGAGE